MSAPQQQESPNAQIRACSDLMAELFEAKDHKERLETELAKIVEDKKKKDAEIKTAGTKIDALIDRLRGRQLPELPIIQEIEKQEAVTADPAPVPAEQPAEPVDPNLIKVETTTDTGYIHLIKNGVTRSCAPIEAREVLVGKDEPANATHDMLEEQGRKATELATQAQLLKLWNVLSPLAPKCEIWPEFQDSGEQLLVAGENKLLLAANYASAFEDQYGHRFAEMTQDELLQIFVTVAEERAEAEAAKAAETTEVDPAPADYTLKIEGDTAFLTKGDLTSGTTISIEAATVAAIEARWCALPDLTEQQLPEVWQALQSGELGTQPLNENVIGMPARLASAKADPSAIKVLRKPDNRFIFKVGSKHYEMNATQAETLEKKGLWVDTVRIQGDPYQLSQEELEMIVLSEFVEPYELSDPDEFRSSEPKPARKPRGSKNKNSDDQPAA